MHMYMYNVHIFPTGPRLLHLYIHVYYTVYCNFLYCTVHVHVHVVMFFRKLANTAFQKFSDNNQYIKIRFEMNYQKLLEETTTEY